MLSRQAEAVMLDLDRSGAPKVPADGLVWICRAGTTRHPGRFRPGTSLLELFGDGRQGYSAPKARQWALYLRNVGYVLEGAMVQVPGQEPQARVTGSVGNNKREVPHAGYTVIGRSR
jgi:hypothetical protein